MGRNGKEAAQRLLAILVIMAMLNVMGIPVTVIVFFAVVVFFVWRAVQRSEQQDVRAIFEFYVAANDILRDEERRWYGFEIAEVIHRGERVAHSIPDAPPLLFFALGALHHRAGDHHAAAEHLAYVVESEQGDEARRFDHSPELHRYVQELRRIERDPAEAPQTMAAMRSLDRMRRARAAALLEESRRLACETAAAVEARSRRPELKENRLGPAPATPRQQQGHSRPPLQAATPPAPLAAPPPIAEVLRDVYEEEKKTA